MARTSTPSTEQTITVENPRHLALFPALRRAIDEIQTAQREWTGPSAVVATLPFENFVVGGRLFNALRSESLLPTGEEIHVLTGPNPASMVQGLEHAELEVVQGKWRRRFAGDGGLDFANTATAGELAYSTARSTVITGTRDGRTEKIGPVQVPTTIAAITYAIAVASDYEISTWIEDPDRHARSWYRDAALLLARANPDELIEELNHVEQRDLEFLKDMLQDHFRGFVSQVRKGVIVDSSGQLTTSVLACVRQNVSVVHAAIEERLPVLKKAGQDRPLDRLGAKFKNFFAGGRHDTIAERAARAAAAIDTGDKVSLADTQCLAIANGMGDPLKMLLRGNGPERTPARSLSR